MRGNIIEELYYGNIDPQDRGLTPSSYWVLSLNA